GDSGAQIPAAGMSEQQTPILDSLEQLRECSLIVVDEADGELRYRLLETLREFGAEQLSAVEQQSLAQRHAEFFLALAERTEPMINSAERYVWLGRLEAELDNFRAALGSCLDSGVQAFRHSGVQEKAVSSPDRLNARTPECLAMGLRLASALGDFWAHSG